MRFRHLGISPQSLCVPFHLLIERSRTSDLSQNKDTAIAIMMMTLARGTRCDLLYAAVTFFPLVPFIFFVPAAFLPGFRSTVPVAFSTAPSTLSLIVGLLFFAAGARFLVTPPVALALVLEVPVVVRLRVGSVETVSKTRGLAFPVAPRVWAILEIRQVFGVCGRS